MHQSLAEAIAQSWIIPPGPTLGILIVGVLYLRGWRVARVTRPRELPPWRAFCFVSGLLILWLALASPLDALDSFLLVAHMTQHLLLMSVAPPLLLLGAPVVPLLRGLPRSFVREDLAPWMQSRAIHGLGKLFTSPMFGWIAMDLSLVLWHLPIAYELALRSSFWHQMEHACFFFTSLSFWWFVVRPWPSKIRSSPWLIIPYLASAHLIMFFVGLVIALDPRVIYPSYATVPRLFGIGALTDQTLAGGEMILAGLLVIVIALVPILRRLLSDRPRDAQSAASTAERRPGGEARFPAPAIDLLRMPAIGAALRSRYGRSALQFCSVVAMSLVVVDGLCGVQIGPFNAAGALLWDIVRPINLILLLLAANVFCMSCPFTLPRELVRRLGIPQLRWPERLSSKWPAVVLMVLFFWAYERFAYWKSPRDTALLLLAYAAAATVVNAAFRGAAFCKYVCPVGQINFLASLFAPLELGVRSRQVCSHCSTHDCVRGNETHRGCELKLYLPTKPGNLDCTLCMDCVKACPQDNVSITLHSPLRELTRNPARSPAGRSFLRPDLAVLILVVVFSSVANAAIMTEPVARIFSRLRQHSPWAPGSLFSLLAVALLAAALLWVCMGAARLLQSLAAGQEFRTVFCRFSLALLPLGLSIWLGHLAFHLVSAWPAVPALSQHLLAQAAPAHAAPVLHNPRAESSASIVTGLLGNGGNLFDLQIWIVNVGLFLAWYAGGKVIRQMVSPGRRMWAMWAVWGAGSAALYSVAVWIFAQPMYMRGMSL